MLLELLCILLILFIVWWYYEHYQYFKGLSTMPRMKITLPIVGNLHYMADVKNLYWIIHENLMKIGNGKYIRGCAFNYFGMAIAEPKILENLLNNPNVEKSRLYYILHNVMGTGLLTSGGKKWHTRQKLLKPAYHFKSLEQCIDVFDTNSHILVKKLQENIGCQIDVVPFLELCALDIICESAMGTVVNAQNCSNSEFVQATKELSKGAIEKAFFNFLYPFTPMYRKEMKHIKIVHGFIESVIQARRNKLIQHKLVDDDKLNKNKINNIDNNDSYKKTSKFLDILLCSTLNGESLSDMDIREEVTTFMLAGYETTSAALSFCIYCIAKQPQIQDKLLAEQRDIFGDNPQRKTTYDDLREMKYLEMVIKETLRLYPSVPIFARKVSADTTINEFTFKKGTEIIVSTYSIHRNPEIYPNPEVFDPERFTLEENLKRHPYAYLPFSAGSRICVGQKFAMLEIKSIMGNLVRNFVFDEVKGFEVKLVSAISLATENGIEVNIKKRLW